MKLTLMIKGEEKIFSTPFVSGMHFRKLLEFDQRIDYSNMGTDDFDELVGFVCQVFGDQFTPDEFWNGIPSGEVVNTLLSVFYYVRTGEEQKAKKEEGNDEGK
ncbi:phage tail assembly chaperone G [Amphibacillus sp. Q70]|uniref:phage tail assembly chaperone G n=1 Tax=Amphibacillus sp. Q70 TaxID=3453416 RepID=UPI003F8257D9